MNILFISISSLPHISEHAISLDLLHEFCRNGHNVHIVCALEKRSGEDTYLSEEADCKVLRVRIGNNKKANIIEKGITTLMLPDIYIKAIKKYYSDIKFDLVLYPTPPVTHVKTVEYIKKRDNAASYLLLKDIFPQNAIDIGLLSKGGLKGIAYRRFRNMEKKLYSVSDYIGCMSDANVEFLLKHNPSVDKSKVEVCPNSIEVYDKSISKDRALELRRKYNIPEDKTVFVYGGNLGKPQGVAFIIECLKRERDNKDVFFVIVGDGTDFGRLKDYLDSSSQENVLIMKTIPKEDYDELVAACDVGLIFLDHRFTIPNFPSRLLSYMQSKIPVLACTDPNTDIGKVITEGEFGWWCESNDTEAFHDAVAKAVKDLRGGVLDAEAEFQYLEDNYNSAKAYETIVDHLA